MRYLLFIPTFNEVGNIELLLRSITADYPYLDILIVDDNSTDGTIESISRLNFSQLMLIVRPSKLGIGSAHILALNFARKNNYDFLITMDGDGAHQPVLIKEFLDKSSRYDLVIGSRYLVNNSLIEWSIIRKVITHSIHLITKLSLNLKYDNSSAFRCYRIKHMPESLFSSLQSTGYDFFFESLFNLNKYRLLRITEIPIYLPARIYGNSKLTLKLAIKASKTLLSLIIKRLLIK
jgi:dolichol-phosphate mannosyltransferase